MTLPLSPMLDFVLISAAGLLAGLLTFIIGAECRTYYIRIRGRGRR
jgi:hypothetical protein